MVIFRSFFSGLLSIWFVLWECLVLLWLAFRGKAGAYKKVRDVWRDRSKWELAAYYTGLSMLLCWPTVLCYLKIGNGRQWCLVNLALGGIFVVAGLVTLTAIGARRRYGWLCPDGQAYEARLFAGFLPMGMMLSVHGKGARTVLAEVLGMLVVLLIVPASINWCLYLQYHDAFHILPPETSVSFIDFCLYSIVTAFTVGYGDIAPKAWESQVVAGFQIVFAWIYLIYLLPLLSTILRQPARPLPLGRAGGNTQACVDSVVRHAVDRLVDTQDPSGCWRKRLSSDIVSTAFTCRALRNCGTWWLFPPQQILHDARTWCDSTLENEQDSDVRATVELCLHHEEVPVRGITFREGEDLARRPIRMLLWIAYVTCGDANSAADSAQTVAFPRIEEWRREFGEHWSTYAQVTQLLRAELHNERAEVDRLAAQLSQKRTEGGSWFGDILLTSVCVLVLQHCDVRSTAWHDAATWLREQLDPKVQGLPLVSGLDVWHTAMAVRLLLDVGLAQQDALDAAERWLVAELMRGYRWAWSWSSEAKMICLDSTSAVVEALHDRSTRDIELRRIVDKTRETIRDCGNLAGLETYQWPTFTQADHPLHPCPIISARCLRLAIENPLDRRNAATSLIDMVSSGQWTSPWFRNEALTLGLVSWYAAPLVDPRCPALITLVEKLTEQATHVRELGAEECGATALGLLAGAHSASSTDDTNRAISAMARELLARESDGRWTGSPTGVFGFGRHYSDDHFATVLAIRALLEYGSR